VVHYGLVSAVWNVGLSSINSVVVRGVTGTIVLHTLRRGELELSPQSRMACNDGDLLRIMPPEPHVDVGPLRVANPGCRRGWSTSRVSLMLIEEHALLAAMMSLCG
jgi:hypothetical protein